MNKIKKRIGGVTASFVLCAALLILFLYDPQASSAQLFRGLELCSRSLVPSLFPYMVISEMLVRSGSLSFVAPVLSKLSNRLFGVSGSGATAMLLGAVCGFPVGAKVAAELYEKELITKDEAERLTGFCSLPSAPFLIFAVGEKLFGSRQIGILLYSETVAAAIICGFASARGKRRPPTTREDGSKKAPPLSDIFTESVSSAAASVLRICAYVAFFSAAVGGISSLATGFSPVLHACLISTLELTSAAAACSSLTDIGLGLVIVSAAAGWSGLSVLCQIRSVTRTARGSISLKPYLLMKVFSAFFCALMTSVSIAVCPSIIPPLPPASDTAILPPVYPMVFGAAANIFFLVSCLIYLCKELDRRRKI